MKKQLLAGAVAAALTLGAGAMGSAAHADHKSPCGKRDNGGNTLPSGAPTNLNGEQQGNGGYIVLHGNNGYLEIAGNADKGGTIDGKAENGSNNVYGSIDADSSPSVCAGTSATGKVTP